MKQSKDILIKEIDKFSNLDHNNNKHINNIRQLPREVFTTNNPASPNSTSKYFYIVLLLAVFICIYGIDQAYAKSGTFSIDAGISATTDPIVAAVKKYWVTGVALSGAVTALISEGDMRTRAIRAGMGSIAAGGVILGILAAVGSK